MKFCSRCCMVILERKKRGNHFCNHSTAHDSLNCLLLISRIRATAFKQEDLGYEICNSIASEKHLRQLAKSPFVGRILGESLDVIPMSFSLSDPFENFKQKFLLLKPGVYKVFISNISSSEIITVIIIHQNGNYPVIIVIISP